jgi:hypothetical protein
MFELMQIQHLKQYISTLVVKFESQKEKGRNQHFYAIDITPLFNPPYHTEYDAFNHNFLHNPRVLYN